MKAYADERVGVDIARKWDTYDKKVDLPQPGSPRSRMVTVAFSPVSSMMDDRTLSPSSYSECSRRSYCGHSKLEIAVYGCVPDDQRQR